MQDKQEPDYTVISEDELNEYRANSDLASIIKTKGLVPVTASAENLQVLAMVNYLKSQRDNLVPYIEECTDFDELPVSPYRRKPKQKKDKG